ncbi:MAG: hypothetical protein ACRDJX_10055 [Solirubrobacteraceae bacterium]
MAIAPGAVLYERWEKISAPEEGSRVDAHGERFGPDQLWIQDTHPRAYRMILQPNPQMPANLAPGADIAAVYGVTIGYVGSDPLPRAGVHEPLAALQTALAGMPLELGGTVEAVSGRTMPGDRPPTLTYLPSHRLFKARFNPTIGAVLPGPGYSTFEEGADPVSVIRAAIKQGWAHEAGPTLFDGRTVERIDFKRPEHPPAGSPPMPANAPNAHRGATYALVEPANLHPVELVWGANAYRFLAYRYLPATAANLALTSIQEQRPTAKLCTGGASRGRSACLAFRDRHRPTGHEARRVLAPNSA